MAIVHCGGIFCRKFPQLSYLSATVEKSFGHFPQRNHSPNVANNLRNMINKIFITISILFSIQAFSQKFEMKIDSVLNLEIQDLIEKGINEIGYIKWTSNNYGGYPTTYLLWSNENSTFIQKFEDSEYDKNSIKKFKPIEINDSVFFSYYKLHKKELNKENVEHFRYKPDSIVGNKNYSGRILTSHSTFVHFVIKSENEQFDKQFNFFDLKEYDKKKVYASKRNYTKEEIKKWEERGWEGMETEIIHENYPQRNINYDLNKELKIVEWEEIMSKFIGKLESENKFELIKTE